MRTVPRPLGSRSPDTRAGYFFEQFAEDLRIYALSHEISSGAQNLSVLAGTVTLADRRRVTQKSQSRPRSGEQTVC